MKDIDFDELDRAVSSVLGQQSPKDDDATTSQAVAVATESAPVVTATDAPAITKTESEVETSDEGRAAIPAAPLAAKRRGKFMDVMHPSHDMSSATPAAPVAPTKRPVLQPLSSDVKPDAQAEEPANSSMVEPTAELDESHAMIGAEPIPVENLLPEHTADAVTEQTDTTSPESSEEVTPATTETTPTESGASEEAGEPVKSLYVDPLDLAKTDEQTEEEVSPEAVTEGAEAADSAVTEVSETTDTQSEPSGTPFLTDAQVDKRPLGAFGETEGAATPEAPESPSSNPSDTQAAPAVPLPRELQPDVVEVESSAQEGETSPVPLTSGVKAAEAEDGRVEGHPLFDTSTYHEPIAAVHGKGIPGWAKWLIGLLICLALGAGVGYFLFAAGL